MAEKPGWEGETGGTGVSNVMPTFALSLGRL